MDRRKLIGGLASTGLLGVAGPSIIRPADSQIIQFSGSDLPPGVTLQQIDGGPNYYGDNGFAYAHNAGWDDPSFFPIGPWLAPLLDQSFANRWRDLGLNTAFGFTSNSPLSLMRSNGIWAVVLNQELASVLATNRSLGSESVGLLSFDEPSTVTQGVSDPISGAGGATNAIQDNRFWWMNLTVAWPVFKNLGRTRFWSMNWPVFKDLGRTPSATALSMLVTTPNGITQRHIDIQSVDFYWFSGARAVPPNFALRSGGSVYGGVGAPPLTVDQCARGNHYGDMIDYIRPFQLGHYPAPILQFVENGGPFLESATAASYITPPEMNWGVWSSIIHGARAICYFNHSPVGPGASQDNFSTAYYRKVQDGQTISIYDQAKATNALIKQLAPVINSPFALNYVTASPAGYNFPTITKNISDGIDVMAKYYNRAFYVFATTRNSESDTNISAFFTIADKSASSVTVINESRTISVANGVFSDTFANAWTVHIYHVN